MFNKTANKVKFQDQQIDDYILENSVLKSKLQSKMDALSILSKELDKCSMERDKYKVLVEQLKLNKTIMLESPNGRNSYRHNLTNAISAGEMLAKTRDHNNMLKLEVETLRSRIEEATGDILALRKQLQRRESIEEINGSREQSTTSYSNQEYEQLVQELEKVQKQYQQVLLDYRGVTDEKEELISDRDYYKSKVQRLNHQISYILSNRVKSQDDKDNSPKPIVDLDSLVMENKYLHERITQLQIEKEIIKRTLNKYKTLLDNRSKNETLNIKKGFVDVMTQRQVREFLDINSKIGIKKTSASELKSLCLGLFEALNDKSIALQHQRKTNHILANRITELEKTLESWCNGQKYIPMFPSQMLLEEFLQDANSVKSDENRSESNEMTQVNDKNNYSDSDDDEKSNGEIPEPKTVNSFECSDERGKTVLPFELEELVREALAEMKPAE